MKATTAVLYSALIHSLLTPSRSAPNRAPSTTKKDERKKAKALLIESLEDASWDDDRIRILELVVEHRRFKCKEIARILETLDWDEARVKACRLLAPQTKDPENAHCISSSFTWTGHARKGLRCFR